MVKLYRAFLNSNRIYLRALEESDITEDYVAWLNDPEGTRHMESGRFPASVQSILQYLERFQHGEGDVIFAIIDRATEKHIGNVTLTSIHQTHRSAHTGLMLGNKDFWGQGYAFEAWSLIIEYAFDRLGLRKIIAGARAKNEASVTILKKLGFKEEGVFRKEFFSEGEFVDSIHMGLFRQEFHKFAKQGAEHTEQQARTGE